MESKIAVAEDQVSGRMENSLNAEKRAVAKMSTSESGIRMVFSVVNEHREER
jgi:hypothetical protein